MIRRSLALVLAAFVLYFGAEAQTPPAAPDKAESFSFFFDGDGGYLGVQTADVTKENFAKFGLKEVRGVAVEKVIPGSPAEKAGVLAGDVIVAFNGDEVTSVRKLTRLLGEVAVDHQAKVTVIRNGGERELTATIAKRPGVKFGEGSYTWTTPPNVQLPPTPEIGPMPKFDNMPRLDVPMPDMPDKPFVWQAFSGRRIGAGVTTLTKQLSEHFGVAGGVLINDVRADSPAAKAGLKAGDIIVEAEGKEVRGEGDLMRIIQEKKEGDVSLTIVRDGNRQTIRVTPEKMEGGFDMHFDSPETMIAPDGFKFAIPATPMPPMDFKFTTPIAPTPMVDFKFPGRVL